MPFPSASLRFPGEFPHWVAVGRGVQGVGDKYLFNSLETRLGDVSVSLHCLSFCLACRISGSQLGGAEQILIG